VVIASWSWARATIRFRSSQMSSFDGLQDADRPPIGCAPTLSFDASGKGTRMVQGKQSPGTNPLGRRRNINPTVRERFCVAPSFDPHERARDFADCALRGSIEKINVFWNPVSWLPASSTRCPV
jgi:hypothetical protein